MVPCHGIPKDWQCCMPEDGTETLRSLWWSNSIGLTEILGVKAPVSAVMGKVTCCYKYCLKTWLNAPTLRHELRQGQLC